MSIWLLSTKSQESPQFPYVQVACHISRWELQFCFRIHLNWRFAHKVMGPQSHRSPNFGNFKTPNWESLDSHLGILRQNDIWVLVLWPGTEYTIREKVVASPKFGPWWVLFVRVCPWLVCAPKCCNYALTNLLFSLCKSIWVIELLVNLFNPHLRAPAHLSTPEVL